MRFFPALQRLRLGRPANEELLLRLHLSQPKKSDDPLYRYEYVISRPGGTMRTGFEKVVKIEQLALCQYLALTSFASRSTFPSDQVLETAPHRASPRARGMRRTHGSQRTGCFASSRTIADRFKLFIVNKYQPTLSHSLDQLIFARTNRNQILSDSTMPDETSEPEATEKKRAHWTVFPNGNGT